MSNKSRSLLIITIVFIVGALIGSAIPKHNDTVRGEGRLIYIEDKKGNLFIVDEMQSSLITTKIDNQGRITYYKESKVNAENNLRKTGGK